MAVIEKYEAPTAFDGISEQKCAMLWDAIKNEERYLMSHISTKRNDYKMSIHEFMADFLDMDIDAPIIKTRLKTIIRTWLKSNVLAEKEVNLTVVDPKSYRHNSRVKIITVGTVKPGV